MRRFWDDPDFRTPAVRLPADRFRAAVLFVPFVDFFFFLFPVVPLFRETLPPPSGMSGRFSITSSAVSEMRLPAPSSCRCSVPITRPTDSAERISSDSSSRDRSRCFLAGSTLSRLASPSSSSRAGCPSQWIQQAPGQAPSPRDRANVTTLAGSGTSNGLNVQEWRLFGAPHNCSDKANHAS